MAEKTTPEINKALVLEAFDTLFNKRDYDAAADFWSDTYIQHSAHLDPGRTDFSTWSGAYPVPIITNINLRSRKATTSSSTDASPEISFTGGGGGAFGRSTLLSRLLSSQTGIWSYAAQVSQPIFTGGARRRNLTLAESQHRQELIAYKQVIQLAFRDVSDALIGYGTKTEAG